MAHDEETEAGFNAKVRSEVFRVELHKHGEGYKSGRVA